jgi:hypothetical protein
MHRAESAVKSIAALIGHSATVVGSTDRAGIKASEIVIN